MDIIDIFFDDIIERSIYKPHFIVLACNIDMTIHALNYKSYSNKIQTLNSINIPIYVFNPLILIPNKISNVWNMYIINIIRIKPPINNIKDIIKNFNNNKNNNYVLLCDGSDVESLYKMKLIYNILMHDKHSTILLRRCETRV